MTEVEQVVLYEQQSGKQSFSNSKIAMGFRRVPVFLLWLLTAFLAVPLSATNADSDSELMLARAVEDYSAAMEEGSRDKQLSAFARSEQLFRQVIETLRSDGQQPNAELLINLGNSALQAEHLGVAVVNYRRALMHSPDSDKARQNLAYARSQLDEWAQYNADDPLIDTLFFWRRSFSRASILGSAALSFLLAALLIAASIALRRSLLRNLAFLPITVWAVLLLSLVGNREGQRDGVIIAGEVVLRSANSVNSQSVLSQPLPDGTEVKILDRRDDWVEVSMTGRSGWIQAKEIEVVDLAPD